jgi:hypothetical protein
MEQVLTSLNKSDIEFHMEGVWLDSYEVDQHIQHFGLFKDPVYWKLIGYKVESQREFSDGKYFIKK